MSKIIDKGTTIDYTPGSAVAAGDVVLVGSLLGIAPDAIAASATGALQVTGKVQLTKPNDEAWTQGLAIYWDADAEKATSTATSYFAGFAAAVAAETAVVGDVILAPCVVDAVGSGSGS